MISTDISDVKRSQPRFHILQKKVKLIQVTLIKVKELKVFVLCWLFLYCDDEIADTQIILENPGV